MRTNITYGEKYLELYVGSVKTEDLPEGLILQMQCIVQNIS